MNRAVFIIAVLLAPALAFAQTERKTLPSPPYVASLPDPGHWIAKVTRESSPGGSAPIDPRHPLAVEIETTLFASLRHDKTTWNDGSTTEGWLIGLTYYHKNPTRSAILIDETSDPYANAPSPREWTEFNWLSANTFTDRATFEEVKCLVFTAPDGQKVYIDESTRQPVAWIKGGQKTVYTFLAKPTAAPVMSGDYAAQAERVRRFKARNTLQPGSR